MTDINENAIRERVHWLWHQAGSPEGQDLALWLQAERELKAEGGELGSNGGIATSADEVSKQGHDRPDNFSPTPYGSNS